HRSPTSSAPERGPSLSGARTHPADGALRCAGARASLDEQRARYVAPRIVGATRGGGAKDLPAARVEEIGPVRALELVVPVPQQLGLFFGAEQTGLEQRRPLQIAAGITEVEVAGLEGPPSPRSPAADCK